MIDPAAFEATSGKCGYGKKNLHALAVRIGNRNPDVVAKKVLDLLRKFRRGKAPKLCEVLPDFAAPAIFARADWTGFGGDDR